MTMMPPENERRRMRGAPEFPQPATAAVDAEPETAEEAALNADEWMERWVQAAGRANRAEARAAKLEAALKRYGQHIHSCHMVLPGGQLPEDECKIAWMAADHLGIGEKAPSEEECDCGLRAALED